MDDKAHFDEKTEKLNDEIKFLQIRITELEKTDIRRKELEAKIKEDETKLRALFDQTFQFIGLMSLDGTLVDVNRTALDFIGVDAKSVLNKPFWETSWWSHSPELQEKLRQAVRKAAQGEFSRFEATHLDKEGKTHYIDFSLKPIKDESGRVVFMIPEGRDITELKATSDELLKSEKKYAVLVDNLPVGVYRNPPGPQGVFLEINPAIIKILEADSKEEFLKHYAIDFYQDPEDRKRLSEKLISEGFVKNKELQMLTLKGNKIWVMMNAVAKKDENGNILYFDGIIEDITERKEYEERLREARAELGIRVKVRTAELSRANEELRKEVDERKKIVEAFNENKERVGVLNSELLRSNRRLKKLLLTDSHTGLYNHRYLEEVIEAEFHRARRYVHPLSVIMIDIDYFKSINDVYGHQFGDLVLKQFARHLKMAMRKYDIIVRSGGEEFIIISPGIDVVQSLNIGQRILTSMSQYNFGNKSHTVKLKLSLAAVSYPEDRVTKGMGLVNLADQILGKAKESGGNRIYSSLDIRTNKGVVSQKNHKSLNIKLLQGKIDKLTKRSNQSLVEAIFAFAKTIELKDHYTGEHVEETVRYVTSICEVLELPKEEVELIKQGAALHDLGKIGISEKILLKRSKLTKPEFEEIKKHPQIGADILRPIQFLRNIIPLVFYHHEKWDGSGYPSGIRKEEIPIGARIIAIADAYQALTSDRPYRKAYPKEKAMKILKEGAGTQFDPRITAIFLKILQQEK